MAMEFCSATDPYESLRQLHREALAELYRPVPVGPGAMELYRSASGDEPLAADRLFWTRKQEVRHFVRHLLDSGLETIFPIVVEQLTPMLGTAARRKPAAFVRRAILRSLVLRAQAVVHGVQEIGLDARLASDSRLVALLRHHHLLDIDPLQEYIMFRGMHPPFEEQPLGTQTHIGQLYGLALEDIRTYLGASHEAAACLLFRIAYLVDRCVLHERHPILDNP